MNLVLISKSTPDSHDPRGGQWIIQSWGLVMIQEDRSAVSSAFGWRSRRYWLHIHLCNWSEACIMIQLDSRPNWACETGSSSGGAWSPVDFRPWSPRKLFLLICYLSSLQRMGNGMRATSVCIYSLKIILLWIKVRDDLEEPEMIPTSCPFDVLSSFMI